MADDTLLGPSDLIGFQNSVAQSDPYGIAGRSLASWQPDMSTWSPTTSGITSFAKAFASGLLQNYAQQNTANQLNAVMGVLPQLRSDPMSVVAPEGVDATPFATLKGNAIVKNVARQELLAEKNDNRVGLLLNSVLPDLITTKQISAKDALSIASSNDPLGELDSLNLTQAKTATPLESVPDNLRTKLVEEQGNATELKKSLKYIDDAFDKAKQVNGTGQSLLSSLTGIPTYEGNQIQGIADTAIMQADKILGREMNSDVRQRILSLAPKAYDSDAQIDKKKQDLKDYMSSLGKATPILDSLGLSTDKGTSPIINRSAPPAPLPGETKAQYIARLSGGG